jgi:LacI family transcriptional regulator
MQQIADELGLSRLTVSSVINGRAAERRISPATEAHVRAHLEGIGYVPSRLARDLRTGNTRSTTIGVLFGGHFYPHVTEAFRQFFDAFAGDPESLHVVMVPHDRNAEALREFAGHGITRLLWVHAVRDSMEVPDPGAVFPLLRNFDRSVIYNYRFGFGIHEEEFLNAGVTLIGVDRCRELARLATALKAEGHRKLALHFPGSHPEMAKALRRTGLDVVFPPEGNWQGSRPYASAAPALAEWLAHANTEEDVTAACMNNEQLAAFVMRELLQRGVNVPEDIAMTAWAGTPLAEALCAPLTTLRVPVDKMTRAAISALTDKGAVAERQVFRARLVRVPQ